MARRHHVVIVAQNPALATALLSWLGSAGYELAIVTTFAAAKALLETQPVLLIAEVKLGEYNGLHLALKARAAGIPSIVIGPKDPVLARDAESLGAAYLTSVIRRRQVLDAVADKMGETRTLVPTALPTGAELAWQMEQQSDALAHELTTRRVLH